MKVNAESLKTGGAWLGASSGVGVPAYTFFTSYLPPFFPLVSLVTALSGAVLFIVLAWRPKTDDPQDAMPRVVKLGSLSISLSVSLLIAYVLLMQFTTVIAPTQNRLQIGFGKLEWTLTDAGKDWVRTNPAITVKQMIENEAAFDQDRLSILWKTWSIYIAGSLLIFFYFLGFVFWTTGFALLAKHRSLEGKRGTKN